MLNNKLLIVAGALDGASGLILSIIMCRAMNRSFRNVLFGAFGAVDETAAGGDASEFGEVRSAAPDEAAEIMKMARSVVIVPGYGMAVAQAQHKVRELSDALEKEGVEVRFAIHPVAGRMPGHMNVLLAEANVPYDQLLDMDEINPDFPQTDVVLVLGANDVVNPAARHNTGSPIYGMPILEVDKAACVMVVKRSMRAGFAGIENELFYDPKTLMVFGDARAAVGGGLDAGSRTRAPQQPPTPPRVAPTRGQKVRMTARIGPVASRALLQVAPQESIAEAARQMTARKVGSAIVMTDEGPGIITERDVLRAVAAGSDLEAAPRRGVHDPQRDHRLRGLGPPRGRPADGRRRLSPPHRPGPRRTGGGHPLHPRPPDGAAAGIRAGRFAIDPVDWRSWALRG